MRIDVHAHYSPTAYFDRMEQLGAFEELPVFQILRSVWRPDSRKPSGLPSPGRDDVDARLADMDAAKVDMQVLSVGAAQPYFADEVKATEAARLINEMTATVVRAHPRRFSAFATLPLPHPPAAAGEAVYALDELGCAGVCIGCSAHGVTLDDARFDPLWRTLNDRSAVVFVHPGSAINCIPGCDEHHLAPDFVSPAEIAVAASRLIVTGLTDRYPHVQFLLATSGGGLPFFVRRFARGFRQEDADAADGVGDLIERFRTFYFDTSVLEEPLVLERTAELFGAAQIVLGSDYPRPGVTSVAAVDYVLGCDTLSDHQKRLILDENAGRLLSLGNT